MSGVNRGAVVTLTVEKAVAGGRMLARHEGRVVLVWGALPGERVAARIDRVVKQMAWGTTLEVLEASPERRPVTHDWRCGGHVYAHAAYAHQVAMKGAVILDALNRIGRLGWSSLPPVMASPEVGYRMRTRLHVQGRKIGFYREETHEICDAAGTGQCLPETVAAIDWVRTALEGDQLRGVTALDIAENAAGTDRVCHLELGAQGAPDAAAGLLDVPGVTGVVATTGGTYSPVAGATAVAEAVRAGAASAAPLVTLRRDPRAFFQGNRHLLQALVSQVHAAVTDGPVFDLYAGVGLFGLTLAAGRRARVTLVEGDPVSGADLVANAVASGTAVQACRLPVEDFLRSAPPEAATVVVDPPRTGMSREALDRLVALRSPRIVYVSCDPPTFARDAALFTAAGYGLNSVQGFDLFPNTAHVELVAVLDRRAN